MGHDPPPGPVQAERGRHPRRTPRRGRGRTFEELGAKIPELVSWECGWNITDRPIAYDYAINSSVADSAALKTCPEHWEHQAGVRQWAEFATWVIADYPI